MTRDECQAALLRWGRDQWPAERFDVVASVTVTRSRGAYETHGVVVSTPRDLPHTVGESVMVTARAVVMERALQLLARMVGA